MAWIAILAGVVLLGGCILRKTAGTEAFPIFQTNGNCIYDGAWSTAGTFEFESGQVTEARGFVIDLAGTIFAAGKSTDADGISHWIVRRSADGGRTWSASESYQLESGYDAEPNGIFLAGDGAIYVVGIARNANIWIPTATAMSTERYSHTATLLSNGKVLVTGGQGASGALSSSEIYDPTLDTWTSTATAMSTERYSHTATLLSNGKVLVTGGQGASGALSSSEIYDPTLDTWTSTATAMSTERYLHTATLLSNGKVLVTGGQGASGALSSSEINSPKHWIVRVTRDSGSSWTTVDDFVYENSSSKKGDSVAMSISGDLFGGVYAAGYAFDADKGYNLGILRSSTDFGSTWATVESAIYNHDVDDLSQSGADTKYQAVSVVGLPGTGESDPVGLLVVAGTGINSANSKTEWVTRYATISSSGVGTLGTSDVFNYATGTVSTPKAIGGHFDPTGTQIAVAGESVDGSAVAHWIVRRLVTSFGAWETVDDFALSSGVSSSAASAFFDETAGKFFVSGYAGDAVAGQDRWVLRESADFGGSWSTLDSFLYSAGGGSHAAYFATDSLGARYAIGNVSDGTNSPWLFRSQACRRAQMVTPGGGHPVRE